MLPGIGGVNTRKLVNYFGSPKAVFEATKKDLETIEGIGSKRIHEILRFDFKAIEEEIAFIKKHHIRPLFFQDADYPQRLLNCIDSPAMLYYKGNANLNAPKIIAIVGTRSPSAYGKKMCTQLVESLADENIITVSGLAYGIDTLAHRESLQNNIPTIGVLAHGLDMIYPNANKPLAAKMLQSGGIITEFRTGTIPGKMNFPARNRIIAGLSDCVIVVESGSKGGSLITAEIGNGYNKDVYTFPGRVDDAKSIGCNYLIKTNKAGLITSGEDLLLSMGWAKKKKKSRQVQRELFVELTDDEQIIYNLLADSQLSVDELYLKSQLSGSSVAQALLMLEMKGIIHTLPGKIYELA